MAERQLYRSRNAFLGGVCAGIAERLDADAIVLRIFAIMLTLVTFGLAIIVYVAMWVKLPLEPEGPEPLDVMPESASSNAFGAISYMSDGTINPTHLAGERAAADLPIIARLAMAVGLMLLFLVVSVNVSSLVPGTKWWQFWPLAFMIVGLCLIVIPMRSDFEALWHALGVVLTSASATVLPVALGITPSDQLIGPLMTLLPLALISAILIVVGVVVKKGFITIGASIIFALYCLMSLYLLAFPSAAVSMAAFAFEGVPQIVA